MSVRSLALLPICALLACGGGGAGGAVEPTSPANGGSGAPAASGACDPAPDASEGPIAWYHDDYPAALACAKKRGVPIVIDQWAPWCHTCLSMKTTVLADTALAPLADRFVWLAVDTDKEVNVRVVDAFPPAAWPTFFVVSPDDESIQARFVGGASLKQFRDMLGEGEKAYLDSKAGALPDGSPLKLVRDAHQAEAAEDWAGAAKLYEQALRAAEPDWPRRPDMLVSLMGVLYRAGEYMRCAELGASQYGRTGSSASAADFGYFTLACVQALEKDRAFAEKYLGQLTVRIQGLARDPRTPMSIDDRSDALRIVREMLEARGREAEAKQVAEEQRALLDKAIREAPTPFAAMTYNWPASEVYVYLGRPAELVPVLEKSVADLPSQYDPPYRLGWIYLQTGEHDKALAMANKALTLAYGPRKVRVQMLVAQIHAARNDREAARAALVRVIELQEALPEGQRSASAIADARKKIEEIDALPPAADN